MIINDTIFNCELDDILDRLEMFQNRKDSGDNIMVCCPYHNERRPSAGIRKSDGLFHCFACNEVHTLPEVISHIFNADDMGAYGWKWLLKNFLTVSVEEREEIPLDFERNTKYNVTVNVDTVSEEELDRYRYTHPYMYQRGLTDEVIELFDIGYDSSSDCITFPVRDVRGNTLFIARRSTKTKFFNYPKDVEKPLYGLYEIEKTSFISKEPIFSKHAVNINDKKMWFNDTVNGSITIKKYPSEVVVCESMLDALSFWTVNKQAVALNGLGNELQFKQLRELPCRELILCTDMDEAGMKARERIRKNVRNKLISEYILPTGRKDANECTKEELKQLKQVY